LDAGQSETDAEALDAGDASSADTSEADASAVDAVPSDDALPSSDASTPDVSFGAPEWVKEGVVYHVYVRSFADSNGDGFGDLPGLSSKLDYIQGLGVTAVLLLPIFVDDGFGSGGYLTHDYTHVAPDYGGDSAYDALIAAAHGRGLKIALDLSFSLISTQHPWFVAARASPTAPERKHFVLAGPPCPVLTNLANQNGWRELAPGDACYWCDYDPSTCAALDVRDASTAASLVDVGRLWLDRGADGYRLDSAASIAQVDPASPTVKDQSSPATHAFWRRFMLATKIKNPSSFTVAELFDHTNDYFADGIDLSFDYLTWYGLDWSWLHRRAVDPANAGFAELLPYQVSLRPPGFWGGGFLGNHDVPGNVLAPYGRVADILCPEPCQDSAALRASAMLLLALPATPFIYYGEELGLHGSTDLGGRRWSRGPMLWDDSSGHGFTSGTAWVAFSNDATSVAQQQGRPGSMLESYRALIRLRKSSPALTRGDFLPVPSSAPELNAFLRSAPTERVLVVSSFATSTVSATLDLSQAAITTASVSEYLFGTAQSPVTSANRGAYPVSLPARGTVWLRLQ
jgi:glycosidase